GRRVALTTPASSPPRRGLDARAADAAAARAARADPRLRLLLFANLDAAAAPAKGAPEAPTPRVDEKLLRPLLAALPADCFCNEAATPAALRGADFARYDIVHLLAHGALDPTGERGHGVALAADPQHPDGMLWRRAVVGRSVPGLVILSGCQVGRAPRRLGEDPSENLGGAFLRAGATAVIQSRADLRLSEIAELMHCLHAR